MRNLLASRQERVFFKDADSRFVLVSEGWLHDQGAGRTLGEVIGKTDFDIFSRPHAAAAFIDEQQVIATGQPMEAKIERETFEDRPDRWVSTTKLPLLDARGRIVGTFGISRDVTAQVEAERERSRVTAQLAVARDQAVEASNLKSAFLANVSHEIRTPMNGVVGMTELLLDTELTAEQHKFAEQIARSGEQMLAIINDVLDLSKIEAGRLELAIGEFDLPEAIRETCAVARAQAHAKQLALELRIADAVPRRVRGDGRRLQQVVLNLASNAVKFTSAGVVTVRVGARPISESRSAVRIEVSDTGIGIEPAFLDHLFEPFSQADSSTTRDYGGTGLGLAISHELIELMGGTITAASDLGVGSTFRIELELEHAGANEPEERHAQPEVAAWPTPPLVLVAEDSPVNQLVVARTLERIGCRCDVVVDGQQAVEAVQHKSYDAVLMDCQMPRLDGFQATAAIRRLKGEVAGVPVIAMTAFAMDDDRKRCLAAGMDDYISKPLRRALLAETLHRWIPTTGAEADSRPERSAA